MHGLEQNGDFSEEVLFVSGGRSRSVLQKLQQLLLPQLCLRAASRPGVQRSPEGRTDAANLRLRKLFRKRKTSAPVTLDPKRRSSERPSSLSLSTFSINAPPPALP